MKYVSKNPRETHNIAREIIQDAVKKKGGKALIFGLKGELGSGKTEFVKGAAKFLGIKDDINSPTFVLIHPYEIDFNGFKHMYHIDAYRLDSHETMLPLGIMEMFDEPDSIVFIEWPEKIEKILPKDVFFVNLSIINNQRLIKYGGK